MKEMTKHFASLLLMNVGLVFLLNKRSGSEYKIELVKQPIRDVVISAASIGIIFVFISIFFLIILEWHRNMMLVLAGILISFGT